MFSKILPQNLREITGNYINTLRLKKIHYQHRKFHNKEYERFERILDLYRKSGGLRHIFQGYKMFSLSRLLEEEKPLAVLELGTGTTTAVFADYIRKREGTKLVSIDESEFWLEKSKELAGITEKNTRMELIHAKKIFIDNVFPKEVKYDIQFDKSFDFVFIDGPSLRVDGMKHKDAINSNIFDIASSQLPRVIVVDIRKSTVDAIVERLGGYYDIFISDVITRNFRAGYRYFSIFRKKHSVSEKSRFNN